MMKRAMGWILTAAIVVGGVAPVLAATTSDNASKTAVAKKGKKKGGKKGKKGGKKRKAQVSASFGSESSR